MHLVKPDHFGYLSILLVTSTALCGNIDISNTIAPIFCNGLFQKQMYNPATLPITILYVLTQIHANLSAKMYKMKNKKFLQTCKLKIKQTTVLWYFAHEWDHLVVKKDGVTKR